MSKKIAFIPARYASSRFPGKPLAIIGGTSMIMRVYKQAMKSQADEVWVLTDDNRIHEHVLNQNGKSVLTSALHDSGTERCAEAADLLQLKEDDIILNVQGDEPFIQPDQIDLLFCAFQAKNTAGIATLVKRILSVEEYYNPNLPKVVLNHLGFAVYFSRSPISGIRDEKPETALLNSPFYRHIGLYGYRNSVLQKIIREKSCNWEKNEKLEQLRWLYYGYTIKAIETEIETLSIDVPEDLQKTEAFLKAD